jgi:hypothetical protein
MKNSERIKRNNSKFLFFAERTKTYNVVFCAIDGYPNERSIVAYSDLIVTTEVSETLHYLEVTNHSRVSKHDARILLGDKQFSSLLSKAREKLRRLDIINHPVI